MTPSSWPGAYMRKRPTRAGRPLRSASVGAVGFGDLWRIPDDVCAVVVAVPGFNVTDRVTNGGEAVVLVVGREVRDDGAVVEVCHMRGSLCCISPIADGQRQGRASCRLNPRAMRTGATRSHAQGARDRAWRAWRGPEWSGRTAAPQAGLTRRDLARLYTRRSAGVRVSRRLRRCSCLRVRPRRCLGTLAIRCRGRWRRMGGNEQAAIVAGEVHWPGRTDGRGGRGGAAPRHAGGRRRRARRGAGARRTRGARLADAAQRDPRRT